MFCVVNANVQQVLIAHGGKGLHVHLRGGGETHPLELCPGQVIKYPNDSMAANKNHLCGVHGLKERNRQAVTRDK